MNRFFLLAVIGGLLFLAPPASCSTHRLAGQPGPGEFQGGGPGWEQPIALGPVGHPLGDRFSHPGDKVLLAKASSPSKKKG